MSICLFKIIHSMNKKVENVRIKAAAAKKIETFLNIG